MATYSTKTAWDDSINYDDHAKTNDYTKQEKYKDPSTEEETRKQLSSLPNELLDYVNEMLNVDKDGTPIKFRLNSALALQYRTGDDQGWDDTASATGSVPDFSTLQTDYNACINQGKYRMQAGSSNRPNDLPSDAVMMLYVFTKKFPASTMRLVQLTFPVAGNTYNFFWRTAQIASDNTVTWGDWRHVAHTNVTDSLDARLTSAEGDIDSLEGGVIPEGATSLSDYNNATSQGIYYVSSSASNGPSDFSASSYVVVFTKTVSSVERIMQVVLPNSNSDNFWWRVKYGGTPTWGDWRHVANASDVSTLTTWKTTADGKISNLETATAEDNGDKIVTVASGTSTASNVNFIKKFGNVVTVCWRFTAPSTGANGDKVGTLPSSDYYPSHNQFVIAIDRDSKTPQQIRIDKDNGEITMNSTYTGGHVFGLQCTFLTA